MNVEYAISRGEGTLIEFGVMEWWVLQELVMPRRRFDETVIFQPCEDECETGE